MTPRSPTADDRAKWRRMYLDGKSARDIAEATGWPRVVIHRSLLSGGAYLLGMGGR